uniref:Reverse transcriptase domain-containing protein n=1 Tax=Nicotiana tabacum TaxID=4097 RepID=A0A1S3Y923_TOBAC|nr:PREDICTED: uncharacterized protein LOC107773929 [Nicotiana tabacum]
MAQKTAPLCGHSAENFTGPYNDILRHYNRKTTPRCLMKIDLKKAYDMVRWEIIEEMLKGYGFPMPFIPLIMVCVTKTTFIVKVNGGGFGYFEGKRGLRQEDPMFPLLFVLVMEYLTRVLNKMSDLPDFQFHPMCKSTKLTHLIFADDLMLFCKGNFQSIHGMMEVVNHFSEVSESVANMEKSNIFLAGMDDELKQIILSNTGFSVCTLPMRYLGLPLTSKKWSKVECHQLVEKIIKKINSGYSKQLSYAGRLQVINVVLFAVYNFWGAVFILPQRVIKEVNRKCREYLWGSTEGHRKMALVAWDLICRPKKCGGLNIKGCKLWNMVSVENCYGN